MAPDYGDLDDGYGEPDYDPYLDDPDHYREPDGDDRYDEYKDDLAMGRVHLDGSYREPDEPDWGSYRNYEPERFWRVRYRVRRILGSPWRWRIRARWQRGPAEPYSDDPPF